VPFFIVSDVPWVLENVPDWTGGQQLVLSHHNIYPTLVSLLSKTRAVHNGSYQSISSPDLSQPPLRYVYGPLWGGSQVFEVDLQRLRPFLPPDAAIRPPA
jgi:hypothetical protein